MSKLSNKATYANVRSRSFAYLNKFLSKYWIQSRDTGRRCPVQMFVYKTGPSAALLCVDFSTPSYLVRKRLRGPTLRMLSTLTLLHMYCLTPVSTVAKNKCFLSVWFHVCNLLCLFVWKHFLPGSGTILSTNNTADKNNVVRIFNQYLLHYLTYDY